DILSSILQTRRLPRVARRIHVFNELLLSENAPAINLTLCGISPRRMEAKMFGTPQRKRTRALTWGKIGRKPLIPQGIVQHETWDEILIRSTQNLLRLAVRTRMRAWGTRWASFPLMPNPSDHMTLQGSVHSPCQEWLVTRAGIAALFSGRI
ncbi:MAG: hypothetical protein C7B47_12040, partial [Sulfobacillus thermosulfidooxidans]